MKILVTGYTGQLGYDVVKQGLDRGLNMVGVSSEDLDITNEKDVNRFINKVMPKAIIHCAAYTGVDNAEDDRIACWNVNVEGVKHLVQAANEIHAKFMYISTDYVFNGEGDEPFKETDLPNPIGYYGLTKHEGEKIVKELLDNWFIVRISWVFGVNGNNFIKTMLRLGASRDTLNVVGDQVGSPTYSLDLARLLIDMIQSDKYGVYHATNEGYCSWAQLAEEIFKQSNKEVNVQVVSTEEYPTRAIRPKNSRMSRQKLVESGFEPLPAWQDAVGRYLHELSQGVNN